MSELESSNLYPFIESYLKEHFPINKENERQIIESFERVRDIPFEVVLPGETGAGKIEVSYEVMLTDIVGRKRGGCAAKHYLLGLAYEVGEIPVDYLTHKFYWKDLIELGVEFPPELAELAQKMPMQNHLSLLIGVTDKRYFLDATWDFPLERAGFPVNKIDGHLTNSILGVVCRTSPIVHQSALGRIKYINKERKKMMKKTDIEVIIEFYARLNQWLKSTRESS